MVSKLLKKRFHPDNWWNGLNYKVKKKIYLFHWMDGFPEEAKEKINLDRYVAEIAMKKR